MSIGSPLLEIVPEWQTYLDTQNDALPYLQITATEFASFSASRQALLQSYIDAACWWAQDYLNQPIAPTTFFRRFNGYTGWGGSMISLPFYPVLTVPTVIEYWGASGSRTDTSCVLVDNEYVVADAATLSTDVGSAVSGQGVPNGAYITAANQGENFTMNVRATQSLGPATVVVSKGVVLALQTPQNQGNSNMFTLDAINGLITRSYLGLLQRPFFPGLKNIEVTWQAGRSPVPGHWRKATLELIKYWWENEQQAGRGLVKMPGTAYDGQPDPHALWGGVPNWISMQFQSAKQIGIA